MSIKTLIEKIKKKLDSSSLPGKDVQFVMAPEGREDVCGDDYRDAAVSIMLYDREGELFFPLIKRTQNRYDRHRGQIGLPGGRYEDSDYDLYHCAVRELGEELGINTAGVERLGQLTRVNIPVSRYRVQPFIVYLGEEMNFKAQEGEVEYILEVKLQDLLKEDNVRYGLISGLPRVKVPYFLLNGHEVWGATAMILNEFKHLLLNLGYYKTK